MADTGGPGRADFAGTTRGRLCEDANDFGVSMTTALRTCPICQAVCGLRLTLDDAGRVTNVQGDKDDPFSQGYICPKGASLGNIDGDPDRLRLPMIREGETWRQVTWDEAF